MRPARPAVADYPPGATFGPRTLRDYELVWLYHGGATWRWNGRAEQLSPGVLLLARPGMRDRFDWDDGHASQHGYAHFDLLDTGTLPPQDTWPIVREVAAESPVPGLIRYLLWLATEPADGWRERAEEILALLVSLFVSGPWPETAPGQQLPSQLEAVLDHIRRCWLTGKLCTFSLTDLAAVGAVSEGHLCRLSRQHFGMGLISALELLRLDRAKTLLVRTNMSVREVGEVCGFASPFHFSRRFRAEFGTPPRDFRQELDADESVSMVSHLVPLSRRIWPDV